jgi:hypothetical protein
LVFSFGAGLHASNEYMLIIAKTSIRQSVAAFDRESLRYGILVELLPCAAERVDEPAAEEVSFLQEGGVKVGQLYFEKSHIFTLFPQVLL